MRSIQRFFSAITRVPRSYEKVLDGVRAAQAAGLGPVKVNCVLLRGFNDGQIEAFAEFSRREGVIVRFIEWMPLEEDRSWSLEKVVTMDEILARLNAMRQVVEMPANAASETARRFTFDDGLGEIGIIAPVSRPFCGHCSRVRLTSDGKIRTCLFSQSDHDFYGLVARGATDDGIGRVHSESDFAQRGTAPHRRRGVREAVTEHGAYRWLINDRRPVMFWRRSMVTLDAGES